MPQGGAGARAAVTNKKQNDRSAQESSINKEDLEHAWRESISREKVNSAESLLETDPDLVDTKLQNIPTKRNNTNVDATALHIASQQGNKDMFKLLMSSDPDVNDIDGNGKTALHYSAEAKNDKMTSELIDAGAEVNHKDKNNRTALHEAANLIDNDRSKSNFSKDNFDKSNNIISEIIAKDSSSINEVDNAGKTALHYSARSGANKAVDTLTSQPERELNIADNAGKTPLHYGAQNGNER